MSLFYETFVGGHKELLRCGRCGEPLQVISRHEDGSYAALGCPRGDPPEHAHVIHLTGGALDLGIVPDEDTS